MSWEAWYTLAVVLATVLVLVLDLLPPSGAFVAAMVAVLAAGIIDPGEAFSGFANPAPITIAAVYVLARAVEKTGALTPVVSTMLGGSDGDRRALARMVVPTAGASAFLNNTPIVAMLMPQIERWAESRNRSVSQYLMPLSFAAILGGLLTVIGTATNLVVSGLFETAGLEPMGFFEISKVGLPIAVVGLALIIILSPLVLPRRQSMRGEIEAGLRQFAVDMVVSPGGPLDGKTVAEGGLRHLRTVFLVQLERNGELIAPVTPSTVLHGNDRLRFAGKADDVVDLARTRGLTSAEIGHVNSLDTNRAAYFEAVVGAASPLVGKTLRQVEFRGKYQAAVLAIHRGGQLVRAKLGSVPLRVGDTLLALSDPGFANRWRDGSDFVVIAPLRASPPVGSRRAILVGLIVAAIVVVSVSGAMPLVTVALLGAVALVVLRILTPGEARSAINLDVVVMIAAAIGLAQAMAASGLAETIADGIVSALDGFGSAGVLLGIVLATTVLKELITTNAAALLVFPVAVSAALSLGLDPRGFGMAVAATAATSFLTPIGYQTNVMVYGPGGYRFTDYLRLGLPLTVVTVVLIVALVPVLWPL